MRDVNRILAKPPEGRIFEEAIDTSRAGRIVGKLSGRASS
jgi:hypothetical protein